MYQNEKDAKRSGVRPAGAGGGPVQLTKEEMRQKIRASLAAREAAEHAGQPTTKNSPGGRTSMPCSTPQTPVNHTKTAPGTRGSVSTATANRTNQEKARQIRESMASRRGNEPGDEPGPRSGALHRPTQPRNDPRPKSPKPPKPAKPTTYRPQGEAVSAKDLRKFFIIFGAIIVFVLAIFYFGGMIYYNGKFLPHTYINNINVGGMTKAEAETALTNAAEDMGITFVSNTGEHITFNGSSFGCQSSIPDGALDEADESHGAWFAKLFTTSEYIVDIDQSYSEDALVSLIAAYDWGNVPPTNATIEQDENGDFYIQDEDNGNMVDTEILSEYALAQIQAGATTIDMASSGCYMTAEVTAADLQDVLATYQAYGTVEITFDMTNREELFDPVGEVVLDHETYMDWITFDDDDTISVDKEAAMAWVQENIADPYDTFCSDGYSRTFNSTADGPVQVTLTPTSTYGWQCDVEATADKIEEYLQAGESISTEPEWVQAGFRPERTDGTVFEEGTYIEIDISEQHLWFYVDGELYVETDVVTGLASDPSRITNTGIFKIREKYRHAVLGTYEVQGYEEPVEYWMPIDHTGIGLHDLGRYAYGGDIYLTNGSHGCINLPLDKAGEIFEKTVVGMPVVIVD